VSVPQPLRHRLNWLGVATSTSFPVPSTVAETFVPGVGWTTLSIVLPFTAFVEPTSMETPFSVVTWNPESCGSFQSTAKPTPARSVLQSVWWVVQTQPAPTPVIGSVTATTVTVVVPSPLFCAVTVGVWKYVGFCEGTFVEGASARARSAAMPVIARASEAESRCRIRRCRMGLIAATTSPHALRCGPDLGFHLRLISASMVCRRWLATRTRGT